MQLEYLIVFEVLKITFVEFLLLYMFNKNGLRRAKSENYDQKRTMCSQNNISSV